MSQEQQKNNAATKRNANTIAEQAERIGALIGVKKIPKHLCGYTPMGKEIRFDTDEDTYTLMDILEKLAENQAELFKLLTKSEPKKRTVKRKNKQSDEV